MDSALDKYVSLFQKLTVSHRKGYKAPHKAILLLAVMSLVESGDLVNNKIEFSEALRARFRDIWANFIGDSPIFNPEVAMPFWHLKNEASIWKLIPANNSVETIFALTQSTPSSSLKAIRQYVKYAEIPDDLFALIKEPSSRNVLSEVLFEHYIFT